MGTFELPKEVFGRLNVYSGDGFDDLGRMISELESELDLNQDFKKGELPKEFNKNRQTEIVLQSLSNILGANSLVIYFYKFIKDEKENEYNFDNGLLFTKERYDFFRDNLSEDEKGEFDKLNFKWSGTPIIQYEHFGIDKEEGDGKLEFNPIRKKGVFNQIRGPGLRLLTDGRPFTLCNDKTILEAILIDDIEEGKYKNSEEFLQYHSNNLKKILGLGSNSEVLEDLFWYHVYSASFPIKLFGTNTMTLEISSMNEGDVDYSKPFHPKVMRDLQTIANFIGRIIEKDYWVDYMQKQAETERGLRLEIQDKQAQITTLAKYQALSGVMGQVQHRLNNLLSPVGSYLGSLRAAYRRNKQDRAMELIGESNDLTADNIKVAQKFVTRLNTLTSESQTEPKVTNIYDVVNAALQESNLEGIEVIKNYEASTSEIPLQPESFRLALVDILSNGKEAMKMKTDEGYIPKYEISTREDERYFYLTIKDNGTGINPEDFNGEIKNVFNLFQSTHREDEARQDRGVGLATVEKIVNQYHEGEIKVDSKLGEYASFEIRLNKN